MKTILSLILLLASLTVWAQQPIAYWAQNSNSLPGGGAFNPDSFPQMADVGQGELSLLQFDQTLVANGSYQYLQSFAGSTINTQSGFAAGGSLAIQGGNGLSNNGASIVIKVDSSGFADLNISWAQQATATGFNSRTLSWSLDGENYQSITTDTNSSAMAMSLRQFDLSAITELNDQAEVFFKITLAGATNATGNNRFDNILVSGSVLADAGRITVYERDFTTNPFNAGWREVSVNGTERWGWNGSFGNISFSGFVAGSCRANDSWLISPAFNLDAQSDERLSFDIARGFGGTNGLEVYYSTVANAADNFNPADWQLLTTVTTADFSTNNVPVRFADFEQLAQQSGVAYIAFRYAFEEGNCSTWRLANIQLTALANTTVADFACGNPVDRIHTVQGSGFQSPLQGAYVQLEAVVTASFQQTTDGGLGGFYLQEMQANTDANTHTSEGIFVYDNGFGVTVQQGDLVRVAGTVAEYFEETQLTNLTDVAVCGSGYASAVTPVAVSLPVNSFAELEALEGMWVTTAGDYTVSDVFNAVRFGEFTVSNGRLMVPTQVVSPGPDVAAVMAENRRNRLIIDNARTGTNRLPFINGEDSINPLSAVNPIRNGSLLQAGFNGIMSYGFAAYRLRKLEEPRFISAANPRTAEPIIAQGNLRVATYNVENLFVTLQQSGNVCGPNALGCRGARTVSELERQLAKVTSAILAMDAAVYALIEIENDADDATLTLLVERLNQQSTDADWAFIRTGYIGTDAIKPAFIYRANQVAPEGVYAVLDDSVDPDFDTSRQRPALAQSFRTPENAIFTAVGVHLRAKASCPSGNIPDADQGDGQGCWNQWRSRAAAALVRWLETDPTAVADTDYLVLGDFNAYAMEDPMRILAEAGYVNLATATNGGSSNHYSYTFMGEAGSLDHAIASPSLLAQFVEAKAWHINADEIPAFNYTEGNLPGAGNLPKPQSFYNADPFRSSDHDPLVISLQLTPVYPPIAIELQLIRVNRGRSGATLVQLRWSSDTEQALTLYRDDTPVTSLSRPGRYNDQFKDAAASSATYRLCLDATAQCSEPLVVNF